MPSPPETGMTNSSSGATNASAIPEKRKRTKYAARACNECKRRKVKCCGEHPCQRCRRRMMECVFPSDETGNSQDIERLRDQIRQMQTQIDTLTGTVGPFNPANSAASTTLTSIRKRSPQNSTRRGDKSLPPTASEKISYHGVTTFSSNFDIAQQTLRNRGIIEVSKTSGSDEDEDDDDENQHENAQEASPSLSPRRDEHHRRSSVDPLWGITREEAIRLCNVYEEEMGIMYPVLDQAQVMQQIGVLYNHLSPFSMSSSELTLPSPQEQSLSDDDINILKLVFACALTAEAHGKSDLAMRIFRCVKGVASDLVWEPPSIKRLVLITLVSIFHFQIDEESIAWRTIGTAQRLCLEMGLHRSEIYSQQAILAYGKENVLKLFWSVYTLDMRFSMGTGMPYHLDSTDIDASLPRPTNAPYLNTMVSYNRISEKVWRFISSPSRNLHARKEEMAYLDWQVKQWYNSIPDFLKLSSSDISSGSNTNETKHHDQLPPRDAVRSIWRLKALLYLRMNLMKILIYRPVLYTPTLIAQSPVEASTVVDIAKDTIRFVTRLNHSTDIYQLQQIAFNWFLVSGLAVLFLAVAHAPAQFTTNCKEEFYMALGLIEGFSMHSYVSQRLWKSIKGLRKLAPQIGLSSQTPAQSHTDSQLSPAQQSKDEKPLAQNHTNASSNPNINPHGDRMGYRTGAGETGIIGVTNNPQASTQAVTYPLTEQDQKQPLSHHLQQQHQHRHQTQYQSQQPHAHPHLHQHQHQANTDMTNPADDFLLTDGPQMSRELMDWFEAMGDPNQTIISTNIADAVVAADYAASAAQNPSIVNTNNMMAMEMSWPPTDDFMYGYGSELVTILRDCF